MVFGVPVPEWKVWAMDNGQGLLGLYKEVERTSQLDVAAKRMEEIQSVALSLLPRDWRLTQLNRIKEEIELRYARDGREPPTNLVAFLDKAINDIEPSTRTSRGPVP